MWCDGARETRALRVIIGKIVSKTEAPKNLRAFQDLSGRNFWTFRSSLKILVYPNNVQYTINEINLKVYSDDP